MKRIEKCNKKKNRARVQRNSVLAENTKGSWPPISSQSISADMDCEKDLHESIRISTSRVSLCWLYSHPTGS